ncbi:MAG: hypothetical protein KDC35_02260 [Acidobacteria bacterium]|nr:hypothetical protein [Acidobacteriota bacterium]
MLMFACLLWLGQSDADLILVAHPRVEFRSITVRELQLIYLKRMDRLQKQRVVPLQYRHDHPMQKLFERLVMDPHFDLDNYWYEQQVQAGERPPQAVPDEAHLLVYVSRNPGHIGFVSAKLLEDARGLGLVIIPFPKPPG